MKQKSNPKRKRDDEQRDPATGETETGPQRLPGRNQEAERIPTNEPVSEDREWDDDEEDDSIDQRKRA